MLIPNLDLSSLRAWVDLFAFSHLVLFAMSNQSKSDKDVIECNSVLLEGVSNADWNAKISEKTGRVPREQLTVQDVLDLYQEAELAKMGDSRN